MTYKNWTKHWWEVLPHWEDFVQDMVRDSLEQNPHDLPIASLQLHHELRGLRRNHIRSVRRTEL